MIVMMVVHDDQPCYAANDGLSLVSTRPIAHDRQARLMESAPAWLCSGRAVFCGLAQRISAPSLKSRLHALRPQFSVVC